MAGMLANEVKSSAWFLVRSRRSQGLRKRVSLWKREPRAQVFDSTNGRRYIQKRVAVAYLLSLHRPQAPSEFGRPRMLLPCLGPGMPLLPPASCLLGSPTVHGKPCSSQQPFGDFHPGPR